MQSIGGKHCLTVFVATKPAAGRHLAVVAAAAAGGSGVCVCVCAHVRYLNHSPYLFKRFFVFNYVMYRSVQVSAATHRGQRLQIPRELELPAVGKRFTWVLRIKLGSSRARLSKPLYLQRSRIQSGACPFDSIGWPESSSNSPVFASRCCDYRILSIHPAFDMAAGDPSSGLSCLPGKAFTH